MLSPAQRRDWLRLIRTENVGPRTFRALLNQFGGAAAALEALPALAHRGGRLLPPRNPSVSEAEDEIAALEALGGRLVALGEAEYPKALRMLDDAPPLLAVRGRPDILRNHMVAIVGARNASAAGRTIASRLARDLGLAGWTIASGLARGIDTIAHEASLGTSTVAVLAGGLARPYPPQNLALMERIAEEGAVVSEMPLNWEARARDFPRRNRLVSGMSYGVVVVEAALRSGSLITARLANEQGREVFSVPGSPLDPRAEGTNSLIRQGATLVSCAQDILDVLSPMADGHVPSIADASAAPALFPPVPNPDDDVRSRLSMLLGPAPVSIDDLVRLSGFGAPEIQAALLELELAGRIDRPGTGLIALR
ncbi:DNA-processing protein DprA [Xanthobacter sp. TB0139]|uniref:DNA-processing protein DprA n=1 Tax=Xanthobacter sp. TB0139 TaxID=3459178 RepID=UPI0040396389